MAFGQWWRDRRSEGVIQVLLKDPDPLAAVDRVAAMVDGPVVEGLLVLSEQADRREDALRWADVAVRASLLGGSAGNRAEALLNRAVTVLQLENKYQRERLLEQAEGDARGAVEIFEEHAAKEDLIGARCLLARIHVSRGRAADMVVQMAECFRSTAGDPDLRVDVIRVFTDLYWNLSKLEARDVAPQVIPELKSVLTATEDVELRAEVLDALGRAHSFHDENYGAAVEIWSKSAALFRQAGRPGDEVLVRSRIQWLAALVDNERSIQEGLTCLACAPEDTSPENLATVHHVLAAVYRYTDRADEALVAYSRAIDLRAQDPRIFDHTIIFEAATLMLETGRHADARHHLEAALIGPGGPHVWWAVNVELSDLLFTHIGDLGAALRYAEQAVTEAVSLDESDPMMRVASLQRAAILHLMAGDITTSYQRFRLLVPLLTEPSRAVMIGVSRLYDHPVVPMQRSEILWNASIAARAAGHPAEADTWAARGAQLRGTDPSMVTVDDDVLDDPELLTLAVDNRELAQAMAFIHHSPAEALARIAKVSPGLLSDPGLRARTDIVTGMCQEKLGNHEAALAAFQVAVDGSGALEQQYGHWRIAAIHYSRRKYGLAHPHLVACVRLFEAARISFDDVEARMTYLRIGLIRYERLIEVCLRLNLVAEALTAVQQIKSRALLDMLAQQSHRPVDAAFEARAAGLRDEHERWLTEFAAGTGPEGPAEEYPTSPQHRMLSGIVQNQKNAKALQEERDELALFDRLVDEGAPLDFAAIRSLLAGWDSRQA